MGFWCSVAVKGARVFGEHWRSLMSKSELVSSMDTNNDRKKAESGGGILQRFIWKQVEGDVSPNNLKVSSKCEGKSSQKQEGMAYSSATNRDSLMSSGEYVKDHSSLLSLQPWIFRKGSCQNSGESTELNGESSDKCSSTLSRFRDASESQLSPLSPRSVSLGYALGRGRSSLRSRRSRRCSVKPLTSMENCLIPQLYNEHFGIEEFVCSSAPSLTVPALRPLIITDGKRIISKSNGDHMGMPFDHDEINGVSAEVAAVIGVTPLPGLRTPKRKSRKMQHKKLDTSNSQRSYKLAHLQDSCEGMLLFCLGIHIGAISTIISNRREIEKLKSELKHTANLVQDLQEELEMKDSLTVKELPNGGIESHELNDDSWSNMEDSTESLLTKVPTVYVPAEETVENDQHLANAVVDSDSMSKIEAELEAELERLELNMNATSLEGRMSALGELGPDLIADEVHGELKADMFGEGAREGQADANGDSSSTSTTQTHNANYAVSPRDLSLRLHEVIQFRLEEQIKELEKSLDQSRKQLHFMEAEQVLSQRTFSASDMESSSNQESPTVMGQENSLAQPLCLTLSGDALNAYDEAYEEFMRIADTEANLPATTNATEQLHGDPLCSSDRWGTELSTEAKSSTDSKYSGRAPSWEQILRSRGSNEGGESEEVDDEDDTDDEEGKMLIQQIVEKTRQGSPVVLHAQRMLFSMEE